MPRRGVRIKPQQFGGLRLRFPELVKAVTSAGINAKEGPKSHKASSVNSSERLL